jgi:Holliday junction DNA helicase RuvA
MIDYIHGELAELNPTYAVVETAGIGYFINIALPTYTALNGSTRAKLFVYEAIREDAHSLFGFIHPSERQLFMMLISVSGIGANTARMIMSSYGVAEIQQMIATSNAAALSAVKGIGPKTAQRIIVDLRDKVLKLNLSDSNSSQVIAATGETREEAIQALMMLGFAAGVSQKVVDQILKQDPGIQVAQLIRSALKSM